MAETSKIRMNLAAIKKVDPYAKDIVDSTSHVAFYTFNSDQNEWEKTDVEGSFFIYNRNAKPYNSIFINNRLNTTSFVEPITNKFELQAQPPFLLYRNERSRIRGFWFYNSQECERICELVRLLIQGASSDVSASNVESEQLKQDDVNIYNMLLKAQQEFNKSQLSENDLKTQTTCNVLRFFASAKSNSTEAPLSQKFSSKTLSVEQLEKEQIKNPTEHHRNSSTNKSTTTSKESNLSSGFPILTPLPQIGVPDLSTIKISHLTHNPSMYQNGGQSLVEARIQTNHLLPDAKFDYAGKEEFVKPALMPPTMFDKPVDYPKDPIFPEPLNQPQLIAAFKYLIQNDESFVKKLYDAYIKTYSDSTGT